jgi:WD40 repeat protein
MRYYYSHDEKYIISASSDKTLRIWDIDSLSSVRVLRGHTGSIDSVLSIPDSNRVISISEKDQTIRVWDLDSKSPLYSITDEQDYSREIAVSPDGKYAYTYKTRDPSMHSEIIKTWDLTNRKLFKVFKGDNTSMGDGIVVSPDGKKLITTTWQDYKIKVWRLNDFKLLCTFDKHKGYIASFFISNDGKYVVSASNHQFLDYRRTIKKWELETAKETLSIEYTQDSTFSPVKDRKNEAHGIISIVPLPNDDNLIISTSRGGALQIWDLQGETDLITLKGHEGWVHDVKVIKNRNLAVSCSENKTLKIWDLSHIKDTQSYFGHRVDITSITLSSDARLAITFSWDGDMNPMYYGV